MRGSSGRFYQYLQQLDLIVHFWFLSANWKRWWIKKGLDLFCSRCLHCCQFLTERLELSVSTLNKINNRYQTLKLWVIYFGINGMFAWAIESRFTQQGQLDYPGIQSIAGKSTVLSMQREIGTIFRVYKEQKILLLTSLAGLPTLPIIFLTKLQFRGSVKKNHKL